MNLRRILTIAAVTAVALAVVSRVPTLRVLVLNRPRTLGPAISGEDAPIITLEGF